MKKILLFSILLLVGFEALAQAQTSVQTGRYLTVETKPLASQQDLLLQTFQVHFPESIQTVGDAVTYLLQNSGYRLKVNKEENVTYLLKEPLPLAHRQLGPITLKEGLTTLVAPSFYLVVDPVQRLVSFKLKPSYQFWEKRT